MPVVMVEKQKVELSFEQVLSAVKQLTPEELSQLRMELLDQAWQAQLNHVLSRIRQRAAIAPLSDADIDAEVETVRAARHAQGRR